MRFSAVSAAAALAGSALGADHAVRVGNGTALTFTPNNITAAEGDTVTFHFWPKAHSVVQAKFATPCQPMDGGFWSGFVPTSDETKASNTTFQVTVKNASAPIWFYCSQGSHCQGGMVGVINEKPASGNTLEKFVSSAKSAQANVSPNSTVTPGTTGNAKLNNGTSSSTTGSATTTASGAANTTGAASTLELNKNLALSGALGMLAYLFL